MSSPLVDEQIKKATLESRQRFYLSSGYKKKNLNAGIGAAVFILSLALAVGVFVLERRARLAAEAELESVLKQTESFSAEVKAAEEETEELASGYEERLREAENRATILSDKVDTLVRENEAIEYRSFQKDAEAARLRATIQDVRQDRSRLAQILRRKS